MKITRKQAVAVVRKLVAPRYDVVQALGELERFSDCAYLVPGGCMLRQRKRGCITSYDLTAERAVDLLDTLEAIA